MTVFTTSSPRQISFQIWFPYENPSQATPWLCWLLHEQTYICICVAFVMLRDPPWRHPGDDWRQFSWRWAPVDGHSSKNHPERERQRRKSLLFFPLREWFWGCESTFWGESANMQPWCRLSLSEKSGQFQMSFSSLKRGLIITFVYSLRSILHQAL